MNGSKENLILSTMAGVNVFKGYNVITLKT